MKLRKTTLQIGGLSLAQVMEGLNDTAETLLASIERGEAEVSPSTLYATAAILEGVPYVNGAPQNTFVPGLIELAIQHNVLIGAWARLQRFRSS